MKKLKNRIINLGLSYRKEMTFLIIINLILISAIVVGFFLLNNYLVLIFGGLLLLVMDYIYLSRYSSLETKQKDENLRDLINVITFFKVYLNNGYNVYNAINEASKFANVNNKEKMSYLIHQMDEDKSVEPFIEFSRNYDELIIEQLFISIYQMIDEGNDSSYLRQFEMIFNKFSNEVYNDEYLKKEKRLSSSTMFPLIGSGLLIIMISIGVVTIIGDMLNGL